MQRMIVEDQAREEDEEPIIEEDMRKASNGIKNNKAAKRDRVAAELIMYGGN